MIAVERLQGSATEPYLDALAELRIAVFREYPYLYDGTLEYEQSYLRDFGRSARSALVIARDGSRVVGAATALPLLDHGEREALSSPLSAAGIAAEQVYYLGESVLLPEYRGRGIGRAFFVEREQSAREHGFALTAFCAVERPSADPARPADYRAHDDFWSRRGYLRRADIVARFHWRDLGQASESEKPMVFWVKELRT